MARLCLDYGHGGEDPGAIYKERCEKDDTLNLGRAVAKILRRHGVIVDETRTKDITVSLKERSSFEKSGRYDYFISFHRNAFKPEKAKGVETYTYLNRGAKAKKLANKIQSSLVDVGFTDRGVKAANFHVLRETKAPAVLIEIGFIDNTHDNQLFDNKFEKIAKAISKAVLSQLGIRYITPTSPPPKSQTLYRVMAGSYANRDNAKGQVTKLKKAGFDATIMIFNK